MIGAWIEPHKGLIGLVAGVGTACGCILAYRPRKDQGGGTVAGATPTNVRTMQAILWVALRLFLGAIIVP
jgi:hypothetical protein